MNDSSDQAPSGEHRNIVIYVDESGMHEAPYYGYGSLWVNWDRRGDLSRLFDRLRDKYRYRFEIKWGSCKKRPELYKELVEEFFLRRWLMFHAIVVRRSDVDMKRHGSREEARRKHLGMLLKAKISRFARERPGARYLVRADRLPFSYPKSDEMMENILAAQLQKDLATDLLDSVRQCESHATVGIQLADVLLGAVLAAWQQQASHDVRAQLVQHIASCLGWPHLRHDTSPDEVKFNIWHFHDPAHQDERVARTLPVHLRYPDGAPRVRP